MSIRRRGRFLSRTLGVFCLAVGMLMAGGMALGETAPTTRPTSAPTLAQIDWRKGFTLHQPQRYAVLVQNRLRRPADLWPKPKVNGRGILTVMLTDRKEDGSGLFTCQVQVVDGTVEGKSISPLPAARFSFSTSPAGKILIDTQALEQALDPADKGELPAKMARLIITAMQLICYPLPRQEAADGADAIQWKANPFASWLSARWRATRSDGFFHVEGQFARRNTRSKTISSLRYRVTLLENHLLYGTFDWTAFSQGEINMILRLEVYPLPPQANPTTAPATPSTGPADR